MCTGQSTKASLPHEVRTSTEPRQNALYPVTLSSIKQVNPAVRLLQFALSSQSSEESNDVSKANILNASGRKVDPSISVVDTK